MSFDDDIEIEDDEDDYDEISVFGLYQPGSKDQWYQINKVNDYRIDFREVHLEDAVGACLTRDELLERYSGWAETRYDGIYGFYDVQNMITTIVNYFTANPKTKRIELNQLFDSSLEPIFSYLRDQAPSGYAISESYRVTYRKETAEKAKNSYKAISVAQFKKLYLKYYRQALFTKLGIMGFKCANTNETANNIVSLAKSLGFSHEGILRDFINDSYGFTQIRNIGPNDMVWFNAIKLANGKVRECSFPIESRVLAEWHNTHATLITDADLSKVMGKFKEWWDSIPVIVINNEGKL